MQKFTVFTVILTILVVVVSAETFVNKYLPSLKADISSPAATDTLTLPKELDVGGEVPNDEKILAGTDSNSDLLGITDIDPSNIESSNVDMPTSNINSPAKNIDTPTESVTALPKTDEFDIEGFAGTEVTPASAYLTDTLVLNSGFTGAHVEAETQDGTLYKTIDLTDLKGIKVEKYNITDNTNTLAKVYMISFDGTTVLEDTYNVIKLRATQLSDVQVNETNDFGLGSFYMNDVRRSGVAFLTVKIGDKIYGFTYPKQYHPQIKNLISLLLVDF